MFRCDAAAGCLRSQLGLQQQQRGVVTSARARPQTSGTRFLLAGKVSTDLINCKREGLNFKFGLQPTVSKQTARVPVTLDRCTGTEFGDVTGACKPSRSAQSEESAYHICCGHISMFTFNIVAFRI